MSRPPCESQCESESSGSSRSMLVVERKHGGAGGESGRVDEIVVPELDAPRHCGGDPRGDLKNEYVDTNMVCHTRFAMSALLELLFSRLRRGEEEGQGCSWRDRAAGTEHGARDLLERCQQAQIIRKLVTIPPLLAP